MAELEGRRSGRTHVVPLACVMVEDSILLTVRKGRHPTNEYLRSALENVAAAQRLHNVLSSALRASIKWRPGVPFTAMSCSDILTAQLCYASHMAESPMEVILEVRYAVTPGTRYTFSAGKPVGQCPKLPSAEKVYRLQKN